MANIQLYIFLLAFLLPQPCILLSDGDERLIEAQCHNAHAPTTCIQCLNSDNRSLNADKFGIATILIECLDKHAATIGGNMSDLARGAPGASRKGYDECVQLFSQAIELLKSASEKIRSGDYDTADKFVFNARSCNLKCFAYIKKNTSRIEVPSSVSSEMMVFEQLCEATMRMVERF